jgi:hypothetical protein
MLTAIELEGILQNMGFRPSKTGPLPLILATVCALPLASASPTRDATLDHRLPPHTPPVMDLQTYRSVQERPGQDPNLAIALAISGGGHRAANFAVGVMLGLETFSTSSVPRNLLSEIDYFSTVSGGGFAAGAYLASRFDHGRAETNAPYSFRAALEADEGRLLTHLERDYQTTLLSAGVNLQTLGYMDGGDLLEQQFDYSILGAAQRDDTVSFVLGDLFKPAHESSPATLPYWFANATVYENGARFIFTPDILMKYHVRGYTHRMAEATLRNDGYDMPFAVAVKTSASFPVAIPATTLTCASPDDPLNDYLHLLDGGLIDNLGVRSAFDALQQDPAKRRILMVVDAYKGDSHPLSKARTSPSGAQAGYRIMRIALDSDHALLRRHVLRRAAETADGDRDGVEVVFLSFEDLKPKARTRIENINEELATIRKTRADAVLRRMQREINTTLKALEIKELELETTKSEYDLYHDARAIMTSLNITPAEQQLLLDAGQAVVNANRPQLEQILFLQ